MFSWYKMCSIVISSTNSRSGEDLVSFQKNSHAITDKSVKAGCSETELTVYKYIYISIKGVTKNQMDKAAKTNQPDNNND